MMSRPVRRIAIVLGVLIGIGLILPRLKNVDNLRPKLESELTAALGRQVRVDNLSLSIFSGSVSADNISIADDPAFSTEPFVTAKSFRAAVEITPLIFSKALHVTGITLEEPQVLLLRGAGGTWNFSSIGGGAAKQSAPPAELAGRSGKAPSGVLTIDKLSISQGRFLVGTANGAAKPEVYDKVNFEVTDFSATAQFPFALTAALPGGGEFSLQGKCGPISAGNTGATPIQAAMTIRNLDLAASGFVPPSTGILGLVDFEGGISSDGKQATASGTLKTARLKLAAKGARSKRTIYVTFAVDHNLKTNTHTLTQGNVVIGRATARLTGMYQSQGEATALNMKIDGSDMSLDELGDVLPALGVVLPSGSKLQGGALSVAFAITGQTDNPIISGIIRLSNSKLEGFDLGSKLSAIPALSGKNSGSKDTTIQNLSATVRVAAESTTATAINLTIPTLGVVAGGGAISPSGALNFDMNADLNAGEGNGVSFAIEGTTANPKFVPNAKAIVVDAAKQAITGKVAEGRDNRKAARRQY
jgi:AsmA protein